MDVNNNKKLSRFEFEIEGLLAVVDYVLKDKVYNIHRVYVPMKLEGQGIGSKVLGSALEIIENEGAKIIPTCPFVGVYLERHPDKKTLLA
ncbi:MAG: GNAT family N-acetyltransferase [Marinifilaceae bacterium]